MVHEPLNIRQLPLTDLDLFWVGVPVTSLKVARLTSKHTIMKTFVLTFLLSAVMVLQGSAANTGVEPTTDKSETTFERYVRKAVDRVMIFPSAAAGQEMQGTVEVSFKIDNSGKVKILSIESSNTELMDYVVKKLKKIRLDNTGDNDGQAIRYKFVFKQQT